MSQMQGNAQEVLAFLEARGWSLNAIAGLCGNMQSESNINPGIWQSLQEGNYAGGFGLVQWTPATNYTNWAGANGYGITDPNGQLTWIDSVTVPAGQWIPTGAYPLSFDQFKVSGESPEYLASAFLKNFERAGVEVEQERRQQARYWYDYLSQYSGGAEKINTAVEWALQIANDNSHGYDQGNRWGPDYDCSSLLIQAWENAGGAEKINTAVEWALQIANDNSHGYDQGNRWGPDYDCSSLLIQAWENAGVPVKSGGASYTGNMYDVFIACGFTDVTSSVDIQSGGGMIKGDVLLNTQNHTAMHIGNGQVVQASQNEFGGIVGGQTGDQTGQEIGVTSYYNYPWDRVLRYPGGTGGGGGGGIGGAILLRWIPG